jgi:hypothetical protein
MPSQLLVPRDRMFGRPSTETAYLNLALSRAQRVGRRLVEDDRVAVPCVNGGMWVFRCHHCDSFSPLDPEWGIACCFGDGCHRVYRTVAFPERRRRVAIEDELVKRPLTRQHWGVQRALDRDPDGEAETVDELKAELEQQRDIRPVRPSAPGGRAR